jgi:predicted naringenin-chalcone synthase
MSRAGAMDADGGRMILTSFRTVRPRYVAKQEEILPWLAEVHTRAEAAIPHDGRFDRNAFHARMQRLIRHVCCGSDRIASRGFSATDREHAENESHALFDEVAGTAKRTDLYAAEVDDVFMRLYAAEGEPPSDLVHVTCTGYVSPSGAQRIVAKKGWGRRTCVTHAYHMGCYAAVPALRIASGMAQRRTDARIDVVHTELCSLHFDPATHTPEQLVVQSLFADGTARYSLCDAAPPGEPGLRVLALHEIVAEASEDAMKWALGDRGMRMTLSREIPDCLARWVTPFLADLGALAGIDLLAERARCAYAIHPGGPKIIDVVRDALELDEEHVAPSRSILRSYGNMSSATLPHIWQAIVDDDAIPDGTLVISLAFGPGLTLAGAVMRKE